MVALKEEEIQLTCGYENFLILNHQRNIAKLDKIEKSMMMKKFPYF